MKRLLILGLVFMNATLTFGANLYYCPNTVTCTSDNDLSSCQPKGGSSIFNTVLPAGPIPAATYTLITAKMSYSEDSPSSAGYNCIYAYQQASNITRQLLLMPTASKLSLYPDYSLPNSKWIINGGEASCNSNNPDECVFTDQYMLMK
ncbi:MAG: hypothetical protein A3E87_01770 [Gammaproteobacteria bacterium RIFCSPHIGHO2_12_FULL_35_23]|nr:MAG: hypothetical protein A3E87_01770 [Gammaproteobacteria bacterium RIFCSPHIGHO2_12_FULL_35_23]